MFYTKYWLFISELQSFAFEFMLIKLIAKSGFGMTRLFVFLNLYRQIRLYLTFSPNVLAPLDAGVLVALSHTSRSPPPFFGIINIVNRYARGGALCALCARARASVNLHLHGKDALRGAFGRRVRDGAVLSDAAATPTATATARTCRHIY